MMDNEGVQVREARHCLLCEAEGELLYSGLRDRLFGAPGNWSLMQCPKCQLVWLNPCPIPDDISKLYSQYFTHQATDARKKTLSGLRNIAVASILQHRFGYKMEDSSNVLGLVLSGIGPLVDIAGGNVRYLKAGERGRLLDVGCGNGEYLDKMRRFDWDVMGVEPDKKAVSVAQEKFSLDIFKGSLEEAKFPDGYFDAITMNHVLEHASEPIRLLKECRRILKPRGKLVVITPNTKSLGQNTFKDSWLHWDPPRHIFLFNLYSLRASAEISALKIQELRTTAKGARGIWVASRLIKREGILVDYSIKRPGPFLRLQGLIFQAAEHSYRSDAGEELVLIATR